VLWELGDHSAALRVAEESAALVQDSALLESPDIGRALCAGRCTGRPSVASAVFQKACQNAATAVLLQITVVLDQSLKIQIFYTACLLRRCL